MVSGEGKRRKITYATNKEKNHWPKCFIFRSRNSSPKLERVFVHGAFARNYSKQNLTKIFLCSSASKPQNCDHGLQSRGRARFALFPRKTKNREFLFGILAL